MGAPENTAIATRSLPISAESVALIEVISKAAKDPAVDVAKLEKLLDMHERIADRESEKAFNVAMTACQGDLGQVAPDADNPQTRSKYATYAKLDRVLRPIYTRHGFALSFGEDTCEKPETVRVTCIVSHVGGHSRKYHRDMPADGKGAKGGDVMTKTHAAGAAGSYGARYLLKGIFNVAIGEQDDDGNGASRDEAWEKQIADYLSAIDAAADEPSLYNAFRPAWKEAERRKDKGAMRLLGQHKDAAKKRLGIR